MRLIDSVPGVARRCSAHRVADHACDHRQGRWASSQTIVIEVTETPVSTSTSRAVASTAAICSGESGCVSARPQRRRVTRARPSLAPAPGTSRLHAPCRHIMHHAPQAHSRFVSVQVQRSACLWISETTRWRFVLPTTAGHRFVGGAIAVRTPKWGYVAGERCCTIPFIDRYQDDDGSICSRITPNFFLQRCWRGVWVLY